MILYVLQYFTGMINETCFLVKYSVEVPHTHFHDVRHDDQTMEGPRDLKILPHLQKKTVDS